MTIDEVMRLAREASHKYATEANWHGLHAAILTLISEREDAEAEACADLCSHLWTRAGDADECEDAIRARIAARKGGNDE
jgi:hypothetical protein